MNFAPVTELADLLALDEDEMKEGYLSARRGDPKPGPNRGRAFWHGWRCRMMDHGEIKPDAAHMRMIDEYLTYLRNKRKQ